MSERDKEMMRLKAVLCTDGTTRRIESCSLLIREELYQFLPTVGMRNFLLDTTSVTDEESQHFRESMKDIMGDKLISQVWIYVANFRAGMMRLSDLDSGHRKVIYHFVALYCHIFQLEDLSWDQNDMYNVLMSYDRHVAHRYLDMLDMVRLKRAKIEEKFAENLMTIAITEENMNVEEALEYVASSGDNYTLQEKDPGIVNIVEQTVDNGINCAVYNKTSIIYEVCLEPMDKKVIKKMEKRNTSKIGERLLYQVLNDYDFLKSMQGVSRFWRAKWLIAVRKRQKKFYNKVRDEYCPFHGIYGCDICKVYFYVNEFVCKVYYNPSQLINSVVREIGGSEILYHFNRLQLDGVSKMAFFDMMYPGLFRYVLFINKKKRKFHMCRCSQFFREQYGSKHVETRVGVENDKIVGRVAYYGDDFLDVKNCMDLYYEDVQGDYQNKTCLDFDLFFRTATLTLLNDDKWGDRNWNLRSECTHVMYTMAGVFCPCKNEIIRYRQSINIFQVIRMTYNVLHRVMSKDEFLVSYYNRDIPKGVYLIQDDGYYDYDKRMERNGDCILVDVRFEEPYYY